MRNNADQNNIDQEKRYDMIMHLQNQDVTIISGSKTKPKEPRILDGNYLIYCTNSSYKIMTKELGYKTVDDNGRANHGQNYFYSVPVGDVIEFDVIES